MLARMFDEQWAGRSRRDEKVPALHPQPHPCAVCSAACGQLNWMLVSSRVSAYALHHKSRALQGRVFIDRDPRHFGLVLNFLRDGACMLPPDVGGRRELLQEADFYQVPD